MRGALSIFARRAWAGEAGVLGHLVSGALTPVSWAYGLGVSVRNRALDRFGGQQVPGLRVVCVGNLAVGGTGKTPVAAWIARFLMAKGVPTAILSRGYGSDELALHRQWNPDVPVEADSDRIRAAERARDAGALVAVLDDGFQHRRLARDLDLVLLAAEDRFPGRLLPAGPYREPAAALARADAILITRRTASLVRARALAGAVRRVAPSRPIAMVYLAPDAWRDLSGGPAAAPVGGVLAVSAVARPDDFRENVASILDGGVGLLAYPDHHEYSDVDVRRMVSEASGRALVVTEKDAVKLGAWATELPDARVLTQRLVWESGREEVEMRLGWLAGGHQ